MRPTAAFSVEHCYGINGYSFASYETIAKESSQLSTQMSPERTHFEKWIGLCILDYKSKFHANVKREAEKTLRNWKKEKKTMEKENELEELVTSDFQQTIAGIQKLIDENQKTANDLSESIRKKQEEKAILSEKLQQVERQLNNYKLDVRTITEGVEYFTGAKETFERKPTKN